MNFAQLGSRDSAVFTAEAGSTDPDGVATITKLDSVRTVPSIEDKGDHTVNRDTIYSLYRPELVQRYWHPLDAPASIQSLTGNLSLFGIGIYQADASGSAQLTMLGNSGRVYPGSAITLAAPAVTDTFIAWKAGTATAALKDGLDVLLTAAGAFSASKVTAYTSQAPYTRNAALWCASLDLTGVSPWNSYGGVQRAGTLISRRHILSATHYALPAGSTVRFVAQNNAVVERTIVGSISAGSDFEVGLLDSEVPASIKHYKVLPADWRNYMPGLATYGAPGFFFDQEEKVLVGGWYPSYTSLLCGSYSAAWYETPIGGDSGNPLFCVLGGEAVLLGTFLTPYISPFISSYIDPINTAMNSLLAGAQLTTVNLSAYPTF